MMVSITLTQNFIILRQSYTIMLMCKTLKVMTAACYTSRNMPTASSLLLIPITIRDILDFGSGKSKIQLFFANPAKSRPDQFAT